MDHIGGFSAAMAWFAYGAGINDAAHGQLELAFAGRFLAGLFHLHPNRAAAEFTHIGHVGMAAKQGVGAGALNALEGGKRIHVRQEILVLAVGAAMDKQQPLAPHGHGQGRQKGFVLLTQLRVSPLVGAVATALSELGGIAALAGIEPIDDVFIPAALAGGDLPLADQLHHLIGLRAIAHQIAQADDLLNPLAINVCQHRLSGGEVGMQAGDDGGAHRIRGLG